MRRHLPPLNSLKAFEAAGRNLSFSKAAAELCVTQGAVSKHMKALEAYLDRPLFERHSGRISLTEAGRKYLPEVSAALDKLNFATSQLLEINEDKQERLQVNVIPSMSAIWLIPRLQAFNRRHPNIHVDLVTGDGQLNFSNSKADLAIRCLTKDKVDDAARLLLPERLLLIASPKLLEESPINEIKDLLNHRLLPRLTRPNLWQDFLQSLGLNHQKAKYGPGFEHFFMSIQAVKEGLGLALEPSFLVQDDIMRGDLVVPLNLNVMSNYAYYLLSPSYKFNLQKVRLFSDWLGEQLAETTAEN